jgi:hypothetical protein
MKGEDAHENMLGGFFECRDFNHRGNQSDYDIHQRQEIIRIHHPHHSKEVNNMIIKQEPPAVDWLEELLVEAEQKEMVHLKQIGLHRADQMLQAIGILEDSLDQVNDLAGAEIALIESYRERETAKLEKKISWLTFQLEGFIRSQDQKTVNLPHGVCKMRAGRDKVEVIDLDRFKPIAEKYGLLRKVPEASVPDLRAIQAYLKTHSVPPGVILTPATVNFSYQTLKKGATNGDNNIEQRDQTEGRSSAESAGQNQAA